MKTRVSGKLFPAFLALATLLPPSLPAAPPAHGAEVTVQQFSPSGVVKGPQQATARFSAPMVPFGDLTDLAPPFVVLCPVAGTSRWIDSSNWAYDFEKPLPGGIRCSFTMREGLASADGSPVSGRRVFEFTTGGPAVIRQSPWEGSSEVDEKQVFLLGLDADLDFAAARSKVHFAIEGLPERIEVEQVTGEELESIVKGLGRWQRPEEPFVAIRARRAFPNGAKLRLTWDAGIASRSGVATDKPQVFLYQVRQKFRVTTGCRRENAKAGCIPILPLTVSFSAPVPAADAEAVRLVAPGGREIAPEPREPSDGSDPSFVDSLSFAPPFDELATYTLRIPAALRDDAGRALPAEQKDIAIKTGALPVLAKFASRFGLIERLAEPALPVTLRSIEPLLKTTAARPLQAGDAGALGELYANITGTDLRISGDDPRDILFWLRRIAAASRRRSVFEALEQTNADGTPLPNPAKAEEKRSFQLPKTLPTKETEVVGIPLESPGLHIVEIESPLLGAALLAPKQTMYVPAAALVTNLGVHFKHGRESSIAWVTRLDDAKPVEGARVVVADCNGKEIAAADTNANGVARFTGIPVDRDLPSCYGMVQPDSEDATAWRDYSDASALNGLERGLLVVARTGEDMSFVHSSWDSGIESWRFGVGEMWSDAASSIALTTILDRPLFRQGETVHMKHLLRTRTQGGFEIPAAQKLKASIDHAQSGQSWPFELDFDAVGVATGEWTIPPGAKLGNYSVSVQRGDSSFETASFRVEQFRVPLLRGEVLLPPVLPARPKSLTVDLSVRYLAGGGAAALPVLLRRQLSPGSFSPPEDYSSYTVASGSVEDAEHYYDYDEESEEEDDEAAPSAEETKLQAPRELVLDAAGTARVELTDLPVVDKPTDLTLEAEFRDPNGEAVNVATTRTLLPASRLPGIEVEDWVGSEGAMLRPKVVVLTPEGEPAPDTPVRIEVAEQRWISSRKRLVGGFYGYDNRSEIKRLGLLCEGRSDANGVFRCEAKAPAKGQLAVEATVTDPEGNKATTYTDAWISGEDSGFDTKASDRIELVPERKHYEPGETARLQVRMPFQSGTALVTTEREGVGAERIVKLSGDSPVVEVPITGADAPNIFVSVLVVRGRIGEVQPTALLDLGRPAFKLGLAELRVDWKTHRLNVDVKSEREVFRTRETAKMRIQVRRHDGSPAAEGSEVAVAAVDEGLLELSPNRSWNLLEEMMSRRGLEVDTSTSQGQVIGKRHYGRKALPTGGGGGQGSGRELFDTLLFWSPRVKLGAAGEAEVEVPLNDSLTSFRIVAVATSGAGEFGTGATTIRVNRELAIFSGLPPVVREGDRFTAEFTARNTSDKPIAAHVMGAITGAADYEKDLAAQPVMLEPGAAKVVTWDIEIPPGSGELLYGVRVSAAGILDDRINVRQRVVPALPVRVLQSTLEQLDGRLAMPVQTPARSEPRAAGSGIEVRAAASLTASVHTMKDWLRAYPYNCLEQRVSVAIGREDDKAWEKITSELSSYIDDEGLLRYFPGTAQGDDRLTAYVLSISHAAGRALPEEIASRMKRGLAGFVDGSIRRYSAGSLPDLTLRKLSAIEALARVSAAEPRMLVGITISPELWPTSGVLDWWSILAHLPAVADNAKEQQKAEEVLRARMDLSGTTLVFRNEANDALWWMMASGDSNATRLLFHLAEFSLWKEDAPRVLKGALGRRDKGAWQTTVANAWGVLAMRRFAKLYESEPVAGATKVELAGEQKSIEWTTPEPEPALLPWPPAPAELTVTQEGSGKPWITTTSKAAVALEGPLAAGYRITKTVTPVEQRVPGKWSRNDRLLVRLDIDAQRWMWWVVVEDPIPAGASHLHTGLGRGAPPPTPSWTSFRPKDDVWILHPSYAERSMQSWRGYFEYFPPGKSRIEFMIRVNQAGDFLLPPTRVEALYAPEAFGELPNAKLVVEP